MEVDVPNLLKIYVPKVQRYLAGISALRERANPPTVEFEDDKWFKSQPGVRTTAGCYNHKTDRIILSTHIGFYSVIVVLIHELIHAYDSTIHNRSWWHGDCKLFDSIVDYISPTEIHAYYGEAKILKHNSHYRHEFGTLDHETAYLRNRYGDIVVKSPILECGHTDGFISSVHAIQLVRGRYYGGPNPPLHPAPGYTWKDVYILMKKVHTHH